MKIFLETSNYHNFIREQYYTAWDSPYRREKVGQYISSKSGNIVLQTTILLTFIQFTYKYCVQLCFHV